MKISAQPAYKVKVLCSMSSRNVYTCADLHSAQKMANFERLSWTFSVVILVIRIHDGRAIWYGKIPEDDQFSYTVAVTIQKSDEVCSFCSGSIISAQHILTAAHCGYCIDDASRYRVVVHDPSSPTGDKTYAVKEVHRHPDYEHGGGKLELCKQFLAYCVLNRRLDLQSKNDIAIMKLQEKLKLGGPISKLKLSLPSPLTYPMVCNFSGFGNTEISLQTGEYALAFRWTQLTIIDPEECQQKEIHLITDDILCTEDLPNKRSHTDGGDSGGPLVCDGVVYGVLSQGLPNPNHPAIFADVAHYLKFIFDILRKH